MARPLHIIDEDMAELRKIITETRQKVAEAGDAWLELLTVRERQMLVLHEERNMAVQQQAGSVGVGAAAGGADVGVGTATGAALKRLFKVAEVINAITLLVNMVLTLWTPTNYAAVRACAIITFATAVLRGLKAWRKW